MATLANKMIYVPSEDPQRLFESALAQIQGKQLDPYKMPIAARKRVAVPTKIDEISEKKAVADAARALGKLWNISPKLAR